VDCEHGIILKMTVTQDPTDHYQLIPQIKTLQKIIGEGNLKKSNILADNGYNTQKNIEYLYKNELKGFIPNRQQASQNKKRNLKQFSKVNFTYNHDNDTYKCPQNHPLPLKNKCNTENKSKKVYYINKCKNCDFKTECTPGSNYKIITNYSTNYQDKMTQKMELKKTRKFTENETFLRDLSHT
jgi:hypothetical protein